MPRFTNVRISSPAWNLDPLLSAIRAEAEGNVAHLDYPAAWARLRSAQDVIRKAPQGVDHIEASIVDTRARQVEALAREQALER